MKDQKKIRPRTSATRTATHRRRNSTARLDTEQSQEKIMNQGLQDVIEHRRTTNFFEPNHMISDDQIEQTEVSFA